VNLTERIYFWTLSAAALAYVFYLAWQDEFRGASLTWSLALLLIIGIAAFSWWRPKDDIARRARPADNYPPLTGLISFKIPQISVRFLPEVAIIVSERRNTL